MTTASSYSVPYFTEVPATDSQTRKTLGQHRPSRCSPNKSSKAGPGFPNLDVTDNPVLE